MGNDYNVVAVGIIKLYTADNDIALQAVPAAACIPVNPHQFGAGVSLWSLDQDYGLCHKLDG